MRFRYALPIVLGVLAAWLGALFFSGRYLPMVDFPQHAAQLSAWIHLDDQAYGFAEQFEVNWGTPYMLAYILARPFIPLLGIVGALKLVVLLAILSTVAAYDALLRVTNQDRWVCLLAIPFSLGFSFYFGFLNFLLATPLIIGTVVLAIRYGRAPSRGNGLRLAGILALTFCTHGLAFAIAGVAAFAVAVGELPIESRRIPRLWPFAFGVLLLLPWLPGFLGSGHISNHPELWRLGSWRLRDLPASLIAFHRRDITANLFAVILVLAAVVALGSRSRRWHRASLLLLALGGYFLFPFEVRGVAYLHPRFAALLVPGLILAAEGLPSRPPAWLRRAGITLGAIAWMAVLTHRMAVFQEEAKEFDAVTAELPWRLRIRPVIFARETLAVPGLPAYLHFPAYYQAEKGGRLGFSFARFYTNFVRFKPGVEGGMIEDAEWNPRWFDPAVEASRYDCFISRAQNDEAETLLGQAPVRLKARHGQFRVFCAE